MSRAVLPSNEENRLRALKSYHILDTLEEQEFNDLVKLASEICGTPVALISLVDKERQWFKAKTGLDANETHRDQSFCAHAILNPLETLVVEDARTDERFLDNPLVTGQPNIVFYAGVPLINPDGLPMGSLCVIDSKTHSLTKGQLDALKILSKQVITTLELRRQMIELDKANMTLLENNVLIQKFARMAAHDLKNPLSSVLLTSQMLERTLTDNRQRSLATRNVEACKQLVSLIDDMLSYSTSTVLTEHRAVKLEDLLQKITRLIDVPENVTFKLPKESYVLYTSAVALEQIFLNLIGNAIRYNDKPRVQIEVQCHEKDDSYEITISDNGIGIPQEYLERIFEESFTVGVTDRFEQQGTGIGLYTVRALVGKLQGTIYADSVLGEGTTFYLQIPKLPGNLHQAIITTNYTVSAETK